MTYYKTFNIISLDFTKAMPSEMLKLLSPSRTCKDQCRVRRICVYRMCLFFLISRLLMCKHNIVTCFFELWYYDRL